MKNTFLILLSILTLSCKAQIASLYEYDLDLPEGNYYKDLSNDLNKFEGTWHYQNNDTLIVMTLQKKAQVYDSTNNTYEDLIIGEYKMEVNNQIILNYLNRLDDPNITGYEHYIAGMNLLNKNDIPKCLECGDFERRLQVYFTDPERAYIPGGIIFRHHINNSNEEQLIATFIQVGAYAVDDDSYPSDTRIPLSTYTLTKL
ncbi:DUF6705 family protein [Psychroserpens sp. XS_ASV72]|uniref:DUF6705 family protein n=1 Tax=Psychroserpens sp. XS_ASV72 TaxID=3241293 RepID=UPI003512D456